MHERTPASDVVRFAASALGVSVVVGVTLLWLLWGSTTLPARGLLSLLVASVPAWSVIVAAVGASWSRKARFSAGLLAFLLAFDVLALATGWQLLATGPQTVVSRAQAALIVGYQLVLVGSPLVTLLLFAGKRPALFWSADQR